LSEEQSTKCYQALLEIGVPTDVIVLPLTGGLYLEAMGGPPRCSYWNSTKDSPILEKQRDEYYLAGTSALMVAHLMTKVPNQEEWRLKFDVVYLFQVKLLAQTIRAIDLLCSAHCYGDALTLVRSLHSRAYQVILFSLSPELFDEWLRSPRHEKFLDGHMRAELGNLNIHIFPHLYEQFSEVIHGQFQGLADAGYFEQGLFPKVLPIANMAYVSAKFLMGVIGWAGVCALLQDRGSLALPEELNNLQKLYAFLVKGILIPNRFEHLWTMMAEERHWEKVSKTEVSIGKWFDFDEYKRQLDLFHRRSQPKKLGKKYRSTDTGA
jgi:hypothetical protein